MSTLTHFEPDGARFAVLKDCIDDYGVAEDESAEWPNNILSRRAVVYGNGTIARASDAISFAVDSDELDLCIRLANEAATLMEGEEVGMGSESSAGFSAFWICANGDEKPAQIDEALIRARFGDTIFPPASIKIEPLSQESSMFNSVREDAESSCTDDPENSSQYKATLEKWRELISWFAAQQGFRGTACISIGHSEEFWDLSEEEYPPGTKITPCVVPRLLVGLTGKGSLCGLFGFVVNT